MFEQDYIPSRETVLQDQAFDAMQDVPDLTEEMEMVIRGEMTAAEFDTLTTRRESGLESYKLDRNVGAIVPTIYNDYMAIVSDSAQKIVTCNQALIQKLAALASTEEGWTTISTSPLTHCPMFTPSVAIDLLPSIVEQIRTGVKSLPAVAAIYSDVCNGEYTPEQLDSLSEDAVALSSVMSVASSALDNYNNINTIGETFSQEEFNTMLSTYGTIAAAYANDQEEISMSILTTTAGIVHKAYIIVSMSAEGKIDTTAIVPKLTKAARYVEDINRLVGYAGMMSGRINEILGHINKAVS